MKEEKKKIQNSKGITLIVLVVTIIILLILAGVTIAALSGPNGILNNAQEAKKQTIIADIIEQIKLDIASEMANRLGESLNDEEIAQIIDKYGDLSTEQTELKDKILKTDNGNYEIPVSDILGNISEEGTPPTGTATVQPGEEATSTEKYNYTDGEDVATIPVGFTVSTETDEQTIDTGLVVIGPDGSEFVWVPVSDINRMVMCKSKTASRNDQCNIVLSENDTKLICTTHSNSEDICGKLYATGTGESFDKTLAIQTYIQDTALREPDLVNNDNNTSYNNGLFTEESLENEFKEMALSVAKYGGFYVSRYEMGLTKDDNKPVSKNASEDTTVTTSDASNSETNRWYGLYSKAKEYNTNTNVNEEIKSSMIWGSQYDAMMLWMEENGIEVKNGYEETVAKPTSSATRNKETITGKEPNDILNNVFDLWGCHYEWTLEAFSTNSRVFRGGYFSNSNSPSCRVSIFPSYTNSNDSTRLTLIL